MSVKERLDDSKLLFNAGKLEGALISALIAVGATSRKRYSRSQISSDNKAFVQFLVDERAKFTNGAEISVEFKGKVYTLEEVLYKFVRSSLVHEAELDDLISFEYGNFYIDKRGTTDHFTFSSEFVIRLWYVIETAIENKGAFPKGGYDNLPEPIDLRQFAIIKFQWGEHHFEMHCHACSLENLECEVSKESTEWLHMKARDSRNGIIPKESKGVKIIVPAKYILSIEEGPEFSRTRHRKSVDVGIFSADKPVPPNAMAIAVTQKRIQEMQVPQVVQTIRISRPLI
jgi:hypothetical protein